MRFGGIGFLLVTTLTACATEAPAEQVAVGIFAPMGEPIAGLTPAQRDAFERGKRLALAQLTTTPGFGPDVNASSCGGCHERPAIGGSSGRYRDFLMVGRYREDESFEPLGSNGDAREYSIVEGRVPDDATTEVIATRHAIPFFGAGLLSEIPGSEIRGREDPYDRDGDGISGIANLDRELVGRFGRKAQNVTVEQFVRGPLFNHLGITTPTLTDAERAALPIPIVGPVDSEVVDDDGAPDPEMGKEDLIDLLSFVLLLAAPEPDAPTEQSEAGRALFESAQCSSCHVPALRGPRGLVPAYTDLLLHDMGEDLEDGVAQGYAVAYEYRTQPLWGVAASAPYLHDGRADTLDQAIRMHGGEATAARDAFVAFTGDERASVIAFLESLGGRETRTTGSLRPNEPVPAVGAYGGPFRILNDGEQTDFLLGREVFDRDFGVSAGLGPLFNGDSCRGCHSTPTIGGAGFFDVNVIRHGTLDSGGVFSAPSIGTIAHRHSTAGNSRADFDASSNVIELRQTPSVFGLGLVELVADGDIFALADPEDMNGDGISGRAHVLSDGRLGRFGWKAQVPSLAEFARDAISNELGVTVPLHPERTFGFTSDSDGAPDPEVSDNELRTVVEFMRMLAPPPRTRTDVTTEDTGEALFASFGCASCHVPSLPASNGTSVSAFSDFLLHDVAPPDARGIQDGEATIREFRTPPLWGLATSAPFMHDGLAFTLEVAIARHDAEASQARDAVSASSPEDRAALIAFLNSL